MVEKKQYKYPYSNQWKRFTDVTVRCILLQPVSYTHLTHEMAFARDVSSHVVYMADGVICEEGTPKDIFENPSNEKTKEFLARFSRG